MAMKNSSDTEDTGWAPRGSVQRLMNSKTTAEHSPYSLGFLLQVQACTDGAALHWDLQFHVAQDYQLIQAVDFQGFSGLDGLP